MQDLLKNEEADIELCRKLLLSFYRLMMQNQQRYQPVVKKHFGSATKHHLYSDDQRVRSHALYVTQLVDRIGDADFEKLLEVYVDPNDTEGLLFPLRERERLVHHQSILFHHTTRDQQEPALIVTHTHLSTYTVDICGVLLSRLQPARDATQTDTPFIITPSSTKALRDIALAVTMRAAILVHGPPSTGKTHLLTALAERAGRRLVTLHLTDATDAKSLLGNYVCAERPGEFAFQPGVLTKAAQEGHWLLIEDVDLAPDDLIAVVRANYFL